MIKVNFFLEQYVQTPQIIEYIKLKYILDKPLEKIFFLVFMYRPTQIQPPKKSLEIRCLRVKQE